MNKTAYDRGIQKIRKYRKTNPGLYSQWKATLTDKNISDSLRKKLQWLDMAANKKDRGENLKLARERLGLREAMFNSNVDLQNQHNNLAAMMGEYGKDQTNKANVINALGLGVGGVQGYQNMKRNMALMEQLYKGRGLGA